MPLPSQFVGVSDSRLMNMVGASVTPATWRGHGKAWGEWLVLAGSHILWSDPTFLLGVSLRYLLQLRDQGVSATVAQRRLSGVRFHLLLRGSEDVTKAFVIRQALKGWRKERMATECRRPVSYELLVRFVHVLPALCLSPFEVSLFKASFCLEFFGALRVSELVAPAKHKVGGLSRDDVVLVQDAVRVRIRRSKTDLFGRGEWLMLNKVADVLCPVSVVSEYLSWGISAPSFLAHSTGVPLSRFKFSSMFHKCLGALGVDKKDFGTHSFRIGAATEAARAGLWDGDIRRIGRWRSTCYASYVRPDLLI